MLPIDVLFRSGRYCPDRIAVETESDRLTYSEVCERVNTLAAWIQAKVPGTQNRIAICGFNTLSHYFAILATYASGNVWVALNPQNSKRDLDRILDLTEPGLIIADDDCLELFTARSCPLLLGNEFSSVSVRYRGQLPDRQGIGLTDLQAIKFTGGSSGLPKAVLQPYRVGMTHQVHMRIMYGFSQQDTGLAVSPLTHAGGTYILPIASVGGRYILMRKPSAPAILDAIEHRHVSRIFMAPTLLYQLVVEQELHPRSLDSLHAITYGAAPMPVEKIRQAQKVLGPRVDVTYGQTEASQCLTGATREELADERYIGTVGRAGPLVEVEVMDPSGRILPPGKVGEVVARGDLLMRGYLNNPEITSKTIVDGWLHTGDTGSFDADGYLTIRGRLKEMIISGGFNVYPADVESALSRHPGVYESVVFGVTDDKWGERVEAAVVLRQDASHAPATLIDFVKKQLGSVQAPKAVHIVPDLPRNEVGKVVRREVKALLDTQANSKEKV